MLLNLNQWFGLNPRWPFSNYVSRMPGLDKYLVSSQKWEHYKLYLVPYCCFNSISVFHQQGSSHSLEIWNISTLSWKEPIFQLIKTVTIFSVSWFALVMVSPAVPGSDQNIMCLDTVQLHRGRRPPWSVLIFTDTDIWVTADNSCLSLNDVLIMSLRYVSVF